MGSALIFILVLGLLVIVHEWGHFVVARRAGVRVLRFSVGFGPRLVAWKRGHTEYAVSAIPLGGYVKMAGEHREELAHEPWEYLAKPIGTRATIVFAGPFLNYLVAFATLWTVFLIGFPELLPVVGRVFDGMPAQAAGLQVGDRIRAIDSEPIRTWEEMTVRIHQAAGRDVRLLIERAGTQQSLTVTPQPKSVTDPLRRQRTVGLIGIGPSGAFEPYRVGPLAAVVETVRLQAEVAGQTLVALWLTAAGKLPMRESVTGPIGIILMGKDALQMGMASTLSFISIVSFSLALFNLFPIPILDGGHLFFLAVEKLRGRPVSVSIQERSAQVSFVLLVALVLVICVNDLTRFGVFEKLTTLIRP